MKKSLSILALTVGIFLLTGCGDSNSANHPIIGHSYCNPYTSANETYVFLYDGMARYSYWDYTYQYNEYGHFVYTIKGKRVEVRYENSDYWEASLRGTLLRGFTYHSKDNTLVSDDGVKFIMLLD